MSISLHSLAGPALRRALVDGLKLQVGPFVSCLRGDDESFADCLGRYYPDYPLAPPDAFADASLTLRPQSRWQRWRGVPRQICLEDLVPFSECPPYALLAHLEWSFNWCIASRANHYLMVHGAVLERHGRGLILPGAPGSGKSTLSAFLMHRQWRLFSDEFTLIDPASLCLQPFPRLIPLKNDSIGVIRALVPEAQFGPEIPGTRKGLVAHLRPGGEHLQRMHETALPHIVVLPTYKAGSPTICTELGKSMTFGELTKNAFNYGLLGQVGFETIAALTERVRCYRMSYSDLDDANRCLAELIAEP